MLKSKMVKSTESKSQEQYIRDLSKRNNEPEWMLQKRLAAFDIFKSKQMPNLVYGNNIKAGIDLDLSRMDVSQFRKNSIQIKNNNRGVIIEDFNAALKNHEAVLKEKLMGLVPATDKFSAFHNAFLSNLTFVYVPENTDAKERIELTFAAGSNSAEHLIVFIERNSSISFSAISKSINANKAYRSMIVEIFAGRNSTVNYEDAQLLNEASFNFSIKRASAGANSTINWTDCCIGSKTSLSEVTTLLNGCGASAKSRGMFFGSNQQQFCLSARSIHNAPKTVSDILTKGSLTGNGKCIYKGLVKISENAFGSEGRQKEDVLLLSGNASAASIPDLEIDNNEVKCTHGASIGRIGREKLFYMMSRGLNEKQAEQEYVTGFFEPMMQNVQSDGLSENVNKIIENIGH